LSLREAQRRSNLHKNLTFKTPLFSHKLEHLCYTEESMAEEGAGSPSRSANLKYERSISIMSGDPFTNPRSPQWRLGAGPRWHSGATFLYGLAFRIARRLAIPSTDLVDREGSRQAAVTQPARPASSCAHPEAPTLKTAGS
jgi:hypothetical protein